jgi:glucose/mannose transport system substrate-binding protein
VGLQTLKEEKSMSKLVNTLAGLLLLSGLSATPCAAEDVKQLQMLHWWTSGGEAAALNVLKTDMAKQGFTWKDVPIAGGGGDSAMTALKAMVAAGNYPTASQMLGYTALDYAAAGKMGDLTDLAKKEGWDKAVPAPLQKFSVYDGKWMAVPVNVHSANWLWVNKAVLDKIGGTEPKNLDELFALLDKAKAAGVVPLALGGQDWQEATMFDSVVAATGGPEFYKKAFNDLDGEALASPTMKQSFDNLKKLVSYADSNFAGRDWNLATAMVIKGDALLQIIGDWAKGEFKASNKVPGTDYLCPRFPGTDGTVIYLSDMFGMFDVPPDRKAAQEALAKATMSKDVQIAFNVIKGSVPARVDVSDEAFDSCGKKGIADLKASNADGKLLGSLALGYGAPPAVANAYKDVVSKFIHGGSPPAEFIGNALRWPRTCLSCLASDKNPPRRQLLTILQPSAIY